MAAVAPAQLVTRKQTVDFAMAGADADDDRDYEHEVDFNMEGVLENGQLDEVDGSDGELEEASEEDDDDDVEDEEEDSIGPVKLPNGRAESDEDAIEEDYSAIEGSSAEEEDDSDKDSSDAGSAIPEEWEAGSEGAEEGEVEVANRNNCVFCGQDEEHDPCEEFEEYMACAVCGDNSHRQCARDANTLSSEDDPSKWRCPDCVENALEPDNTDEATSQRRSSATKFTRDLLPAQRGASRPGSHSVFNSLILEGDPLDGTRSLRKRKSSDEQEETTIAQKKRRRNPEAVKSNSNGSTTPVPIYHDKDDAEGVVVNDNVANAVDTAEVESTSTRKSRSSRSTKPRIYRNLGTASASVLRGNPDRFVLVIRLDPSKLSRFEDVQPPKKRRRVRHPPADVQHERDRPAPSFSSHYATPFYSFHERENDELKAKPYGGVLSEADADTSKTLPLAADRVRFNEARQRAEDEWKQKTATSEAEVEIKGRTSQKVAGPPSKIKCVNFGGYEIETWYAAPYPEEYSRNRVLYICEFCLKYMNSDYVAWRHKLKCPAKHPPGDEIYRDNSISVFEVDGRKNPVYCQNLCLLAKLFLGSKTLYYDVEPFLFYVMTEYDELGCHFVGYFSKEKRPSSQNNVSCILTLPTHQRKGYGNLLISFSYLLTRVERKTGSPEKPLSDMGLVSYRNYWRLILSYELLDQTTPLSILDLSNQTGMTPDDIVAALEGLRALVRDPVTKSYALRLDHSYFMQCIETWESKNYVTLNPDALVWTPYIMGRSNLAHYDRAPPLPTIAPREGDDDDKPAVVPEEGVQQATKAQAIAAINETATTINGAILAPDDLQLLQHNGLMTDSFQLLSELTPSVPLPSTATSPPFPDSDLTTTFTTTTTSTPIPPIPPLTPKPSNPHLPTSAPNGLSPRIPPTRYELFPPIPGTISRRRGGWRGGPRKSIANGDGKTETPIRKGGQGKVLGGKGMGKGGGGSVGLGIGKGSPGEKSADGRRTRSGVSELEGGLEGEKDAVRETEEEGMGKEDGGDEITDGLEADGPDADIRGDEDVDMNAAEKEHLNNLVGDRRLIGAMEV